MHNTKRFVMHHIPSQNRNQIQMLCLEQCVEKESFVRVIDAFVDLIDLKSFGFKHVTTNEEGRPPYHPATLLKLYLYGYRYGIRSSRKLEYQSKFNLEVKWLLCGQTPSNRTIDYFRKEYAEAFTNVFRKFVFLLKEMGLVEGKTIAVDSFKIRAQNSLKNNFNIAKIKRHKEYIDNRIAEFKRDLDEAQNQEEKAELRQKIETQKKRKAKYETIETQLIESEQEQISLTDSDARAVILHRNIVQVGYTIQAAVDAKNKLITNLETGQVNDTRALAPIALDTKNLLKVEQINILADKGYHTGDQLQQCADANIQTFVSPKDSSSSDDDIFPISRFIYNADSDLYTCPAGQQLRTNNVWYKNSSKGRSPAFRFKRYVTPYCKDCTMRSRCTKGKQNGRAIDRSEYADVIAQNAARVNQSPDYYRLRQQLAEHPMGTMKRHWGFDHVLVRGKKQVLGEVSLIFTCYNLIRCIRILGHQGFHEILEKARKQPKNDSKQPCLGKIMPFYARINLIPAA